MTFKRIGILALQGGFDLHASKVQELGATPVLVKKEAELSGLSGLIIPGGESSVLLHLTSPSFRDAITRRVKESLPLLVTCAGLIFISERVENPEQECLQLLPVTVKRNAYGRQIDSRIIQNIPWEANELHMLKEAVFIRAPKIIKMSNDVKTLIRYQEDPILVQYKQIVAATFHPELSQESSEIYKMAFSCLA